MKKQSTDKIFMVLPNYFGFNSQTAKTNIFQKKFDENESNEDAMREFELMVEKLRENKIDVEVLISNPNTPDAVFPNNWMMSLDDAGVETLIIFPMLTENRRAEVQKEILIDKFSFEKIIDLRDDYTGILEGTGSIVLDRVKKVAYATLSERTEEVLFKELCKLIKFSPIVFKSECNGKPIYHTNVMLAICENFSVICSELISENKKEVLNNLQKRNKPLIKITEEQMLNYCGNLLSLRNKEGKLFTIMSKNAYDNFTKEQIEIIESKSEILSFELDTIEKVGGGSARCMVAEIF